MQSVDWRMKKEQKDQPQKRENKLQKHFISNTAFAVYIVLNINRTCDTKEYVSKSQKTEDMGINFYIYCL